MPLENRELLEQIRDTATYNQLLRAGRMVTTDGSTPNNPVTTPERSIVDRILADAILQLDKRLHGLERVSALLDEAKDDD